MAFITRLSSTVLGLFMSLASIAVRADVVAVVSSKSAALSLTSAQLADLFLGKMIRFPDGGTAVPLDLPEGSAQRDAFYAKIAGKSPAQIKAYWSKIIFTGRGHPPMTVADSLAMKRSIAGNPLAIGYIDEKEIDDSVRRVD